DVRGHADPFRCRHAPPRTRWRPPAADDTPRGPAAPPNRRTGFGFRSAAPPLPRRPDARGGRRRAGGSVAGAARRRRARPRARRRAAPLPGSGPQGATGCRRALLAAAGELLPKRGQGLVGGQRAAGALRAAAGAARGGTRVGVALVGGGRRGGLGLGGLGLLDLLAVRLEAGLRHGVLALPLVALGLEALHPLAGLRVEALGVLVVPLLVVLGGHAVEGRVELLLVRRDALVGLLQREADPAAVEVDVDDLDEDLGADLDDLLGDLHVALGQLGDVHQALDAPLDADGRAERNQLGDLAGDDLADLVRAGELLPGVFLGGLEGQGDALALHVDVEDLDGDLLADLDDLARVVDVLPGQLGDVHQAVHAAQVHERTEVDDRGDDALADLALLQGVEEGLADLRLGLLQPGATGQDHVVAVLVQLDDLGLEVAAHVGLQVADAAHLDQGGREEAAQADVEDETALDDLDDGAG